MQQQVQVTIYCCNRLLGESIAHLLEKKSDFRVATGAPASYSMDSICETSRVVVLDSLQVFSMHRNRLSSPQPNSFAIRTVLVAMEDDSQHFLKAIRGGASGYVLQDASAMDVVAAVRAVAQGEAVCPPRMVRSLFDHVARTPGHAWATNTTPQRSLTRREQELIPLIGDGLTNKEIAARLNLSEETIKSHIHRILRKVGVEDRRSILEAWQVSGL